MIGCLSKSNYLCNPQHINRLHTLHNRHAGTQVATTNNSKRHNENACCKFLRNTLMKTKTWISYLLLATTFMACNGRKNTISQNTLQQDSLPRTTSIAFLGKMGIDADKLLVEIPTAPFKEEIKLTREQWQQLLQGVVYTHATDEYAIGAVYLSAIQKLAQDCYLCIYVLNRKKGKETFFVTYTPDGKKADALLAGSTEQPKELTLTANGEERTYAINHTSAIVFTDRTHFTLSYTYTEGLGNRTPEEQAETYRFDTKAQYEIDKQAIFKQLDRSTNEKGTLAPGGEQDIRLHITQLRQLPQSDDNTLAKWNRVAAMTDGAAAELFELEFIQHLYKVQPQRVLKWLYKRKDRKQNQTTLVHFLETAIWLEYISPDEIMKDIDLIADEQTRLGIKEMASRWKIEEHPMP